MEKTIKHTAWIKIADNIGDAKPQKWGLREKIVPGHANGPVPTTRNTEFHAVCQDTTTI